MPPSTVIIKTNLKPTCGNSVYKLMLLIEDLGGVGEIMSSKLKDVVKDLEKSGGNIKELKVKPGISYSHEEKALSQLNNYAKAVVCAISLNNESNRIDEQKIHTIRSALLVEKLIKDSRFTSSKNKFDSGLLKRIIGKHVDDDTLCHYSSRAKELVDMNFLQFNTPALSALKILKSKESSKALVDCQMRINATDVSIFKEFDTTDAALNYVKMYLLKDIKRQQEPQKLITETIAHKM